MRKLASLPIKRSDLNQGHRVIKLRAKIFIVLILFIEILISMISYLEDIDIGSSPIELIKYVIIITFILVLLIVDLIVIKKKSENDKVYWWLNTLFIGVMVVEWLIVLADSIRVFENSAPGQYSLGNIVFVAGFSWKCLVQEMLSKKWYVKIILPFFTYAFLIIYGLVRTFSGDALLIVNCITQLTFILCIAYFQSQIDFSQLINSLNHEKWWKINQLILNNIPENIAIFDINGKVKYINEYFKKFTQRCGYYDNLHKFLEIIENLNRRHEVVESVANIGDDRGGSRFGTFRQLNFSFDRSRSLQSAMLKKDEVAEEVGPNKFEKYQSLKQLIDNINLFATGCSIGISLP